MSTLAKALSVAILMGAAGQAAAVTGPAVTRALAVIQQNPVPTRLSTSDTFTARAVTVDRNGTEHVRLDRTYKGLSVIGGDLVVHSKAGVFSRASLTQAKPVSLSTTPKITSTAAITAAGVQFGTRFDVLPTAHLVVYARTATPVLAYDVLYVGTRSDGTPTEMHYYVDASTSAILAKEDAVHTGTLPGSGTGTPVAAVGPGNSLMAGQVSLNTQWNPTRRIFEMKDPTRGNTRITDAGNGYRTAVSTLVVDADNKWGNGTMTDRVSTAVDAAYGFRQDLGLLQEQLRSPRHRQRRRRRVRRGPLLDQLRQRLLERQLLLHVLRRRQRHHRASAGGARHHGPRDDPRRHLADRQPDLQQRVGRPERGDVGHHGHDGGVLRQRCGAAAELRHRRGHLRPPQPEQCDPLDVQAEPRPHLAGLLPERDDPSNGITLANFKAMDVHYSSGVANHFFYLLAEGAGGAGRLRRGHAGQPRPERPGLQRQHRPGRHRPRRRTEDLVPRADVYMTSSEDYAKARVDTLLAAADLYGNGSTEYNAVSAAWAAVTMP
jgi:Zn-dependent metalloprotease